MRHLPDVAGGLLLAAAFALAGCGGGAAVGLQADRTYVSLAAASEVSPPPAGTITAGAAAMTDPAAPTVYRAPRRSAEEAAPEPNAAAQTPAASAKGDAPPPLAPLNGRSFSEVLASDLRRAPAAVWRGAKHSFAKPENLLILGLALGADRAVRANVDDEVREDFRRHDTSLAETGDFGSVIGNPVLHLGVAGAWYAASVGRRDAKHHALSTTMLEALSVNALATGLLKVSMDDAAPNGEHWGWPSGHMSSSMCFASVMHEYYGWKVALPLYLLAGYSGASRLEDREHDLSDLVFGAALGWVVGHSVVKGELPQVGGFKVLPYGGPQAGGLMLMKQW